MRILKKTLRFVAIALAVFFILLNLVGICSVWWIDRKAADVVLKAFGLIETGVSVVDAGVGRTHDLVATSRTEVREALETITAVGEQAQANSPVLIALNERLETSLTKRLAQMQQVLAPVREAAGNIANAVSLLSSLPMLAERAPRLAALDESLSRIEEMSADASQLRGTLRAMVELKGEIAPQTVATLNTLTQRIDTRLGEVQANVQGVQTEITALKVRLDKRKSRLLFVFNLAALVSTLMIGWILYTQVVVIRHHWVSIRRRGKGPVPIVD
jgi:predicted  nucleic acid-binding Zn-ribbon protein